MEYDIKETHIIFDAKGIKEIAVLWADNDNLRATYLTTELTAGYGRINVDDTITNDLLQNVAGRGIYLDDKRKKKYFPSVKNWSR